MIRFAAIGLALFQVWIFACAASPAAEETLKIRAGDFTVSYPPGLETQARDLAKAAEEVLTKRFPEHARLIKALSNSKKITSEVAKMLGSDELAASLNDQYSRMVAAGADLATTAFRNLRLYKEADLKASGGLTDGAITIRYDPREDAFYTSFGIRNDDKDAARRVFWPYIVTADGVFRTAKPIAEQLAEDFDTWSTMPVAAIHEAAEAILMGALTLQHPYTRWFNDGAANWVTLRIAADLSPAAEAAWRAKALPGKEQAALRPSINLLNWPQAEHSPPALTQRQKQLDSASYQYATEAIARMMEGQPSDAMARIMDKLKGKIKPDTNSILEAMTEVTGKDCRSVFMEYVPADIKKARAAGEASSLVSQAWSLALSNEKDYRQMYDLLARAMEIEPDNANAQFNLAYVMRKLGMPNEESERHAKISAQLVRETHQFEVFEPEDPEALYLMAGMNQYAGNNEQARVMFKAVLERNPNHADAKKALEELDKETILRK